MSEATPTEGVDDSPLPNADLTFKNYSRHAVKRVVVYGIRVKDGFNNRYQYMPMLALFMSDRGEPPVVLNFTTDELFDDAEVMASITVAWATKLYNHVGKTVSIFEYQTEELVRKIDVQELVQMEEAIDEYREILHTNVLKLH